jgi:penicillin G amidase
LNKIITYIFITVVAISLTGFGVITHLLNRSVPEKSGMVDLEFLKAPAKVYNDKWGIPHIYAETQEDAYRVMGYVAASERLFQMDLMRRIAAGRLSEIIGKETIKVDKLLRTLRIRTVMQEYYDKNKNTFDKKMMANTEAFFDGIHQFVKNNPLPIEFTILDYTPEPFSIVDAMAVSGYMSLSFAEAMIGDVLFSELAKDIPQAMVDELRVSAKKSFSKEKFSKSSSFLDKKNFLNNIVSSHDYLNNFFFMFQGSNSWVISGARTESGKPILANDPHIAYSNPAVWFEAHIHTPDWELYGHYMPLVPFAVIGHNRDKAWAITMSEIDDFDFYIEKINPKNSKQVKYKNKWVDLKFEKYSINVKGQDEAIEGEIKISPHGPLLDGLEQSPKGNSVALAWSYYHPDNNILTSFYKLGLAKTIDEHKEAISLAAAPGLNISWVDKQGNIAWWVMGKLPKRPAGIASDILLEGWHGKHDYTGVLPFKNNPHSINPKSGVIISTNYKPTDDKYSEFDGYWQPSERKDRLEEIFASKQLWNLEKMKAVQTDTKTQNANEILPILLESITANTTLEKEAVTILKAWDFMSPVESVGSSIYHVWNTYVMRHALIDEMGEDRFKAFSKLADYWHFYKVFIKSPYSNWWDNTIKPEKVMESREMVIEEAFLSMISFMKNNYGADIKKWNWGNVHTVEYSHPIGKVKPFNYLFNIGPFPAPGSFSQVNNISYRRGILNYESHLGPSTRRLIDMGNPLITYGIIPTGNSGHVKSSHYQDQAKLYLEGKYRKQLLHIDDIKTDSEGITQFK